MTLSTQEISDRLEIDLLLIRYCHAIDERDWDTYRSVYTDDAVIDDIGAGPGNTVDQMVEFLPRALEKVVLIQHAISHKSGRHRRRHGHRQDRLPLPGGA